MDAGIVGTLRRLCEWTGVGLGGGATSPSSPSALGGGGGGAGRRGSNASSPTASIAVPGSGGGGVYGSWGGGGGFGPTYFGHPVYYHSPHHAGVGGHHGHAGGGHLGFGGGLDDDKEVVERARVALDWLEHGDVYVSSGVGA